jgi:hypothetical protein
MTHNLLADARARWEIGDFDPSTPPAEATLARIMSTPVRPQRKRAPRRLAAALVAGIAALSAMAITLPGATPDVVAQAASALGDSADDGITFRGELRYGDGADASNTIRIEGSQKGDVAALVVRGDDVSPDLHEQSGFASVAALFQVALPDLRELLESEDDAVRVVGETTVAGRDVYELRIDRPDRGPWTLFVDRESYLPVRFAVTEPDGSWATLDFAQVERMSRGG